MTEEEEFEFRRRLEQESGAPASTPVQQFNEQQRRMGKGKHGDTMGKIRGTLEHAGYDVGGWATDQAAKVMSPESAAKVGVAANIATEAVPAVLGGEALKLASPAFQSAGRRVMQSALKPTYESLRTGKAAKAIDTMLEEGINVTHGGVDALKAKIADLNDEVTNAIANSTARIDKAQVADRLRGLLDRFEKQVTPGADMKAIQRAWDEFLQHPLLSGAKDMTVQLAQQLKQGTYKSLGSKSYGELKGAEVEAQKALARGLKEEISAAVPEVATLNARESSLINASNVAERRAMLQDNNNIGGLAWLSHEPAAAAGFLADRSGLAKSLIARGLYSGHPWLGRAAGGILGASTGDEQGEGILSKRTAWLGAQ